MPEASLTHDDDDNNEEDYFLAPQSLRPFGAGLKRKRVDFVPASSTNTTTTDWDSSQPTTDSNPSSAPGARYLSIVLDQRPTTTTTTPPPPPPSTTSGPDTSTTICPICLQPLDATNPRAHESSIAHQLSLAHSHPPSSLDRQRKGLKYLEGYGWDPDSRLGLGARSEGIRVPVKAVEKRDTTGLGLRLRDDDDDDVMMTVGKKNKKSTVERREEMPVARLNAKQVRKQEEEKKKKAERLRVMFYGDDLSKYLGPDG